MILFFYRKNTKTFQAVGQFLFFCPSETNRLSRSQLLRISRRSPGDFTNLPRPERISIFQELLPIRYNLSNEPHQWKEHLFQSLAFTVVNDRFLRLLPIVVRKRTSLQGFLGISSFLLKRHSVLADLLS